MKAASLQEIKEELNQLDPIKVRDLCLRLGRFKKENKELLTYLLFESFNEENQCYFFCSFPHFLFICM